jgi:1L-myo-inositol 1-phosphate cytidylyltransferase / CDP-L-myo-inositol myo-inositolphosphotransferase
MVRGQFPTVAAITFASAREAGRRVAGVSVAGRIVRELAEAGFVATWIDIDDEARLDTKAMDDVRRLAGPMTVHFAEPPGDAGVAHVPPDRLIPAGAIAAFFEGRDTGASIDLARADATAEILRRTGKATDGPVSRWINRPVSRVLSAMLLRIPGFRPAHATAGTVALALTMFWALVFGGYWGLLAGAVLFQAASENAYWFPDVTRLVARPMMNRKVVAMSTPVSSAAPDEVARNVARATSPSTPSKTDAAWNNTAPASRPQ